MRSIELAFQGGWKVLYTGLLFGAGMPIIYALAMRTLLVGSTTDVDAQGKQITRLSPVGKALAAILLAVIALGVILGITIIAASGFGKIVVFDGGLPSITDK